MHRFEDRLRVIHVISSTGSYVRYWEWGELGPSIAVAQVAVVYSLCNLFVGA